MKLRTMTQLVALAVASMTSYNGFGQFTGNVDENFADDGILWYDYTGTGTKSTLTKLVLDENSESFYFSGSLNDGAFNAMVVKSSLTGELEPDFAAGTISYDPFIGLDDQFEAVAIQDNGKIVAVGYSIVGAGNSEVVITRFNTDGSIDDTFNDGDPFTFGDGGLDFASDVIIQEDGKIVVIGSYQAGLSDLDLFFVRLNSDGSPDGTFGEDGIQVLDTYLGVELIHAVTILDNGNIASVGQAGEDVLVVQLDTEGNFDTDFSADGTMNFKVNGLPSTAVKLIELDGGSLLLGGYNTDEVVDGNNGFVIKMEENGLFDVSFGGDDGTVILNFETEPGLDTNFVLQDMEVLASGEILVTADYTSDQQDVALVLMDEDGELETGFDDDGMRTYNLSGGSLPNSNSQIEVSATGAVYLSARVINGDFEDIVTTRLFGDISAIYEATHLDFDMQVYPNPVQDQLNVAIDLNTSGTVTVTIVDLMGKVIANERYMNLSEGTTTLSLTHLIENLSSGTYGLKLATETSAVTELFIKN